MIVGQALYTITYLYGIVEALQISCEVGIIASL